MDDHMYSMSSKPEIALTHCKLFVIAAAFKFGCTNCSLNSCETASNQHFNKTHDLFADSLAKRELLKELNHLQESLSEDDLTNSNKMVFMCKKKLWKILHEWTKKMTTEDFSLLLIRKKVPACTDHWASSVLWGWLALQCCIKVLYKVSKFQAHTCSSGGLCNHIHLFLYWVIFCLKSVELYEATPSRVSSSKYLANSLQGDLII